MEISADLLEKLEEVDDSRPRKDSWTPEIDAALVKYWPVKNKEQLAKVLGLSETRARKRYRELTGAE